MTAVRSIARGLRPVALSLLLMPGLAAAQVIIPEPLSDLAIPGFHFPEREATLTRWITDSTHGASAESVDAATDAIARHGWGLWLALTSWSSQTHERQRLRIFETWLTPDELAEGSLANATADLALPMPRGRSLPQSLRKLDRITLVDDPATPIAVSQVDRVLGFVKFDPTAARHIASQDLLNRATLDTLLNAGAQQIPPFPSAAVVVKPIFQIVHIRDLVAGRYAPLKVWTGPPETPRPSQPSEWSSQVWIDVFNAVGGTGAVDEVSVADGASRTAASTYSLSDFIHYRLTAADAEALNRSKPESAAGAGDISLLVAMHVSTREIARWTWQTFWWTPAPDDPPAPSAPRIAQARPPELGGASAHYAMALAYSLLSPDQPYVGGTNSGPAVYAYNPWVEARLGASDLPDSLPGFDPAGRPAANNCGVQTNCMSCHAQANYNPQRLATAPRFTGARYVDLGAAEFVGTLQVDFLWSLARHAR